MRLKSRDMFRLLIKERGLTYGQIGDMAGCHRSMISQLVNGWRTSCTEDLATVLARVLNVPRDLIFEPSESAISGRSDKRKQKRKENAA